MQRREIRSHIGLRGVAALMVVGYHQQFLHGYKFAFERYLFGKAYLMVDLFFILSGFVMCYVYAPKVDAKQFWYARFARIYPLHVFAFAYLTLFALGTTLLLLVTGHEAPPLGPFRDWLNQLLLLNAWYSPINEWNVPSWSISAEALAYLLFPAILAVRERNRVVSDLVLLATSIGFYAFVVSRGGKLDITHELALLRCLAGFGLGILLFHYREVDPLPRSAAQLLAIVWILGSLAFKVVDPVIVPAFAILVLTTWRDEGVVARLLSTPPMHRLGEWSYSVYLTHVPVSMTLWFVWCRFSAVDNAPLRFAWLALAFGGTLAVSAMTHRFVERPSQRWLRSWRQPVEALAP